MNGCASVGNCRLYYACKDGNITIVRLMIEKIPNNYNYNWGLRGACINGNVAITQLMIEKGANEYNGGLSNACYHGNMEIVRLMIEKGANNYNDGLCFSCESGHIEIARLMIEKGANNIYLYRYYSFPKDKNIIQTLLSSSLPLKVFETINGYDQLINAIKEREKYIIHITNNYIDSNINNFLLKEYILNDFYL